MLCSWVWFLIDTKQLVSGFAMEIFQLFNAAVVVNWCVTKESSYRQDQKKLKKIEKTKQVFDMWWKTWRHASVITTTGTKRRRQKQLSQVNGVANKCKQLNLIMKLQTLMKVVRRKKQAADRCVVCLQPFWVNIFVWKIFTLHTWPTCVWPICHPGHQNK